MTRPAPRTLVGARAARSKPILIRLTPEEWQRLETAARRAGLGLGPWLRLLGLRETERRPMSERRA